MWKSIETSYPNYAKLSDLGFHFVTSCLNLSRGSYVCFGLFFGPSRGYPSWTDFGLPSAPFDQMFLIVWKILGAKLFQISKDPRATNGTNHTFKKQARVQN